MPPRTASRPARPESPPAAPPAEMAGLFKLLADPVRLEILRRLAGPGDLPVAALARAVGQSQPATSHHLALLRLAGLIEGERDGKRIRYRVRPGAIAPIVGELKSLAARG